MYSTALHFSGGKDSLACLYLNRHRWHDIHVVWLNTGAVYPEMQAYMDRWRERLPNFVEIKSDQPRQIAANGWPSDVVPVNATRFARSFLKTDAPLIQSYLECCAQNIWLPLHKGTLELGVTEIIKGQRADDARKAPVRDGDKIDGITYRFPIEGWTEAQVFSYLHEIEADMPPGYAQGEKTGRDCWDCTAYLDENRQRIRNLPCDKRRVVEERLAAIRKTIDENWRAV